LRLPPELVQGMTNDLGPRRTPRLEARAVIVDLKAEGYGNTEIARVLNARGVPTTSGRGQWHPRTVMHCVNPEQWAAYIRDYKRRHR